jgi:hypothetical protein
VTKWGNGHYIFAEGWATDSTGVFSGGISEMSRQRNPADSIASVGIEQASSGPTALLAIGLLILVGVAALAIEFGLALRGCFNV